MGCEAIRPVVHQFLDDLLDEKDYQDIQTHLAACPKCRAYASSVGTISYRLHELGQAELPPDMASAILHQMKKAGAKTDGPPPSELSQTAAASNSGLGSQIRNFWIALFVLASLSIAATLTVFLWKAHIAPGMTPPKPRTLETAAVVPVLPERMGERHLHLTVSGRAELAELILELQLAVERESERSLTFLVPAEKSVQFQEHLAAFSGVVKEFGEPAPAENPQDERVTVFFE